MPINKPSQPLIPPTDVEEVEEIAASAAEAAIAADDTHAPLVDNLVPAANLPSYVDDVLEFASVSVFPDPGESGKIYVALDTNNTYRWSGSAYVQVGGSEIDLTPYALKTEVAAAVDTKQDTLVSGTNIKTVNNESILGSGNIEIQGGGVSEEEVVGMLNDILVKGDVSYTDEDGHPCFIVPGYDSVRDTLTHLNPEFLRLFLSEEPLDIPNFFRDTYGRRYHTIEATSAISADLSIDNAAWGFGYPEEEAFPCIHASYEIVTDLETGDAHIEVGEIYSDGDLRPVAKVLSDTELLVDSNARDALGANGITTAPVYTTKYGSTYYFGGEYSVSSLSSDNIIDLAINESVTPDPDILPPLFINKEKSHFNIITNQGSSHFVNTDDEEHEIDLDGFQICYQTLSTSVPQEGLDQPDLRVVNSITVYYNYPGSKQFIESRSGDQVLQLTYNTNDLTITAQDFYNDLYFVRNRGLDNCIPKIPVIVGTDNGAVADECYIQFNTSDSAFLCGSNGTIGLAWYHDKDLGELAVEIDWSLYNIGGGSAPIVDSVNHMLMVNATFANSAFTVTDFHCDDLKPNKWFTNEPTTILLGLTISTRDTEWAVDAPITLYRIDNSGNIGEEEGSSASLYTSTSWEVQYNAKTESVSLLFRADGCNFIDNHGNIAFTLSGLGDPQYNLYTKTPDIVMPIPAENGSFDPSTLPVFTLQDNVLVGDDASILYQEEAYYPGYGPMIPNVIFQFKGENQFGTLISKTEDSYQNPVITVRLLDDQFNPLDAKMVITSISQEEPGDVELRYIINTKQLWCTQQTNYDWLINTDYVIDGWLVFVEPSE